MRDIDIKYPSSEICLLRANRPTNASRTLLLAVAPPAHRSPRNAYEDTFAVHDPRRNDKAPLGPHLRKAVFQNFNNVIRAGTCSMANRPPRPGSRRASNARHRSRDGAEPPIVPKLRMLLEKVLCELFKMCCN